MNNYALKETAKTIARGIWFGLLGIVVLILTVVSTSPDVATATFTLPIFDLSVSVGTLIVAVAASAAKIVDRYIKKSDLPSNGIAPAFLQK